MLSECEHLARFYVESIMYDFSLACKGVWLADVFFFQTVDLCRVGSGKREGMNMGV